jgi:hypothetical protein
VTDINIRGLDGVSDTLRVNFSTFGAATPSRATVSTSMAAPVRLPIR